MAKQQPAHRDHAERDARSGRISRSGTDSGISVGSESTSGGQDPIEPGEHVQPSGHDDGKPTPPRRSQA